MRNEERDVYVIPPNFIEGGTLLGGMFKTRNVIEAGVLGLLVGLPVLNLSFSLTTKVIILCLTALPLVLVALIGIAGSSLSAFVLQFFRFLRNRRILTREPQKDSGDPEKSILPSCLRKKHLGQESKDQEARPVSRSSLRFDRKERKVTQHKTFLPPEEKIRPLNPLADYVPIEKIENGVIYTRDRRYVKVVEVVPVNFLLRSAQEQRGIIYSFISYLKIAPVKVQFKVLTKRADIDRHVETVRKELERETDPHCRMLQEDYLRLIQQLGSREAITRRFFLIFEHEELPGTRRGHEEEEAIASLQTAARTAANYLTKQNRIYYVDGLYCPAPECAEDVDCGLLAAVWVLVDFIDRVEYHSVAEYPAKIIFFADGEIYEIIHAAQGKDTLVSYVLSSAGDHPSRYLVLVDDPGQIEQLQIPHASGYCTVSPEGDVHYYQKE